MFKSLNTLSELTYRSSCIKDLQHTLLSINFDLFPIAVLDRWIVFFNENPLDKLYGQRWFADTTTAQNDNFIFTHDGTVCVCFWLLIWSSLPNCLNRSTQYRANQFQVNTMICITKTIRLTIFGLRWILCLQNGSGCGVNVCCAVRLSRTAAIMLMKTGWFDFPNRLDWF